ncbi:kinesin-like nuclear fusion protein [Dispira parvispora]|uniref:Kinesin-like protein n=1 Tax=Dispira parvispora TaxID=1520584 RepID=A0A9W8E001_9FUNG|nr:kinesin-like nuclear fusion protein [Dispira parvispora]
MSGLPRPGISGLVKPKALSAIGKGETSGIKRKSVESPATPRVLRSQNKSTVAPQTRPVAAARGLTSRLSKPTSTALRKAGTAAAATRPDPSNPRARTVKRPRSGGPTTDVSIPKANPPANGTGFTNSKNKVTSPPVTSGGDTKPKKKKRPAWDTKGRLEDMEEHVGALTRQLQENNDNLGQMYDKLGNSQDKIRELELFRQSLTNKVEVKEQENSQINHQLSEMRQTLEVTQRRHDEELQLVRSKHAQEIAEAKADYANLQRESKALADELAQTQETLTLRNRENSQLKNTISQQSASHLALESDCLALRQKLTSTEETLAARKHYISTLEVQLADSRALSAELEAKLREEETVRRRLHNTIQELKGNIRVFCRVRPLLHSDLGTDSDGKNMTGLIPHIRYPEEANNRNGIELVQSQESATSGKTTVKQYPFTFDRVFRPETTQSTVFEEISQLVQSALDGYPVCIFAYGQTGSGKTHTMEGPNQPTEDTMGMIPRAVRQIYQTATVLREKGWEYQMEGQFLEIYNEAIHDLLANQSDASQSHVGRKHDIKHLPGGKTMVTDLTSVELDSPEKVHQLLKRATQNRAVAATQCNERSSRSHSVFTLRLNGHNTITNETSEGVLNLIDLAGSERLSQSGSTGDRLKETQAINKSLSSLGDVIYAISNRDNHVPYRNSKLTYLLQNSLGGNSKTLMFVNISPVATNFQETLCSLRFATKVNSCQIGTARRNIK